MNATGTDLPPLTVIPENKNERAYGWSIGKLNFGLPSKRLDSD
jgi:hypothetical protein